MGRQLTFYCYSIHFPRRITISIRDGINPVRQNSNLKDRQTVWYPSNQAFFEYERYTKTQQCSL